MEHSEIDITGNSQNLKTIVKSLLIEIEADDLEVTYYQPALYPITVLIDLGERIGKANTTDEDPVFRAVANLSSGEEYLLLEIITRGACINKEKRLMVLVPETKNYIYTPKQDTYISKVRHFDISTVDEGVPVQYTYTHQMLEDYGLGDMELVIVDNALPF